MSSCKVGLSQERHTWRHKRVLQEFAAVMSIANEQSTHREANAVIFTIEGSAKAWHGRSVKTKKKKQRKCLLDGCNDSEVSTDLPEWDSYPNIIKETGLRPYIVINSTFTQQFIMVDLKTEWKRSASTRQSQRYPDLIKEQGDAGYKAVVMPVKVGTGGFK